MEAKQTVGHYAHNLSNLIKRRLLVEERSAALEEVTIMHGRILGFLYRNQGRDICQKDIEDAFSINRSTASSIVSLMERKGYLCRQASPTDARCKHLKLTEKGLTGHEKVMDCIDAIEGAMVRDIDPADLATFFAVAAKIKENLKEDLKDD